VSDFETLQKRRNTIVGVFVLVALVALVWLIFKFQDLPSAISKFTSYQVFVQFASAPGVQKNTPVRLGGYQVGRVLDVMAPQVRRDLATGLTYLQTIVILAIETKYATIPRNADIKLMKRGLGSSYIEICIDPIRPLEPEDPNLPATAYLQDGMTLQGQVGMVSDFFPEESQQQLQDMVNSLSALINNANDILGDKQNKDNIKKALRNLTDVTAQAKATLAEIEQFTSTSRATVQNANQKLSEVANVVLDSGEQISSAARQLNVILEKVNSGQGTAGKLLNDGRLYENLIESTEDLRMALDELRQLMEKTNREGGIQFKVF